MGIFGENFDPRDWVLVTHKDCMDGSTAALLFALAGGGLHTTFFVQPYEVDKVYKQLKHRVNNGWRVMFVDVAPQHEEVRERDVVIDHHASNVDRFVDKENVRIDMSRCGCYLLWEHLIHAVLDERRGELLSLAKNLVEIVDDYDRWQKQRPVAKDLAMLHEIVGADSYVNCFYDKIESFHSKKDPLCPHWPGARVDVGVLDDKEWAIVGAVSKMNERYVDSVCKNSWITNENIVCTFADQCINDVAAALLKKELSCGFALVIDTKRVCLSFRGRGVENDCVKLMRSFQIEGGGHVQAAGAKIPDWLWNDIKGLFS